MEPVVYKIRLDVTKPGSQETIYMKRHDAKTRTVVAFLANQTKPYAIPDGAGAILCAVKPDETVVFNTASVGENGTVYVTVTSGTLAVPGRVQCEMRILGNDGEVLTSPGFDICVEDVLDVDSALESTDEYTALTDALLEVENIAADESARVDAEAARVLAEQGRVLAESGRVGAEGLRVSAEQGRDSAEGLRVSAEQGRVTAEGLRVVAENARDSAELLREQAKAATILATGAANSAAIAANTAAGNADVATGAANTAAGAANLAAGAANSAAGDATLAANAANAAAQKAESAAPYIGANGHWYVWNGTTHTDTNVVAEGRGIASVTLHSGNHAPGSTDTYRITFTDATYYDYPVYNGMDGEGAGDMLKTIYDPTSKNADAFSMGSMTETATAKVMTGAERTKLSGIETGAQVNVSADWNASSGGAQILNKPTLGALAAKNTVAAGDIDSNAVTTVKILDANVTSAKLANMAAYTVKGRNSGTAGVPADVTMLDVAEYALYQGTTETSVADAELVPLTVSATSLKKITWANIKATLKTYFDTLYSVEADIASAISSHNTNSGAHTDLFSAKYDKPLRFTNVSVASGLWTADATYPDYGYKADIPLAGVTADMVPDVVLSLDVAASGKVAPVAESGTGYVRLYAMAVQAEMIIPTITCWKAV